MLGSDVTDPLLIVDQSQLGSILAGVFLCYSSGKCGFGGTSANSANCLGALASDWSCLGPLLSIRSSHPPYIRCDIPSGYSHLEEDRTLDHLDYPGLPGPWTTRCRTFFLDSTARVPLSGCWRSTRSSSVFPRRNPLYRLGGL